MASYLVSTALADTVACAHQAPARPGPGDPRVRLDGAPVVPASTVYTVTGCPQPPPTAANGPCATSTPPWSGTTLRVKAGGQALVLRESTVTCVPTGTPLRVSATQMRVRAS